MWQGKPVSEWTPAEKMEFLNRLIGLEERDFYSHGEHFFMVKSFMEQSLLVVWEGYCDIQTSPRRESKATAADNFDRICSLSNLITFLLDNQEGWAWKKCPECIGEPIKIYPNAFITKIRNSFIQTNKCLICNGTGKVKHPALIYSESLKEVS